ncbi:MAG: glycosyltransferase [Myxococcales bacterium]|jgi:glycosyltransferase involved in cell wall biosynthesis
MQSVHIVIPCYNEVERLPGAHLVAFLRANSWASVCLVNDGSADDTLGLLEDLRGQVPERIDVIDLRQNVGKAEAVRQGMLSSLRRPFELVAYLDADFSTLPEALAEMWAAAKPEHRLILGARVLRAGATIERSALRHYAGRVVATMASASLNLKLYDTQCGAKLIDRQLIEPLFSEPFLSRWLFDLELLLRLRELVGVEAFEASVLEVPLSRWVDRGSSRIRARDVLAVPPVLFRIRRHYR